MGIKVASIRDTVESEGFFSRLKGAIANLFLEPTEVDKLGNTTMLEFGYALLQKNTTFTFPKAKNIKESKEVEDPLEQREEKYRTILETIPDPVVLFDIGCKVEYFNSAFTSVFGWTLNECFGRSINIFLREDAWPEIKSLREKSL